MYKQPYLLQLFLLKAYLKKIKIQHPLQSIRGNLAVWVCCSLAGGSLLSLFLLGLFHSYCLHVLDVPLLPAWKYVALGHGCVLQLLFQLMLHLVTVHQALPHS